MSDIELDDQIQPRVEQKEEVILEYAENLANGAEFPPVDVFYDGETYWLADGFHRYQAYALENRDTIPAIIYKGGRREAIIHAAGANATHGVPRSNADKRRVVGNMLKDPEFNIESDNTIAEWCKVSQPFVSKMRKEFTYNGYKFESVRKCADGRIMETSNIGAKPKTGEAEDPQTVNGTETPHAEMKPDENKQEVPADDSEEERSEISADTAVDPEHKDEESSDQEPRQEEDGQDVNGESADTEDKETSTTEEPIGPNLEDLLSSAVDTEDSSDDDETEGSEPEAGENLTDRLADINYVEILKGKIIELQNIVNENARQIRQKDKRIIELEQEVKGLQDTIKYYEEELLESINPNPAYSSNIDKNPNYQAMHSL